MAHEITTVDAATIFVAGSVTSYLVKKFLDKTVGTRYRTQSQCDECSVRHSMNVIRSLVVKLAIKAGVSEDEVVRIVEQFNHPGEGIRRSHDSELRP